jgi:hypothetical protein
MNNSKLEIKSKNLIITEGRRDKSFYKTILKNINLDKDTQIEDAYSLCKQQGIDAIKKVLLGLEIISGFDQLNNIIIAIDSDDDPISNHNKIEKYITGASHDSISYPELKNNDVKKPIDGYDGLNIGIVMIPSKNEKGHLETLLLSCVKNEYNIDCINQLIICSGISQWPESKLDKMRVECLLSTTFKKNPSIDLSNFIEKSNQPLIDFNHANLQSIKNQLSAILS